MDLQSKSIDWILSDDFYWHFGLGFSLFGKNQAQFIVLYYDANVFSDEVIISFFFLVYLSSFPELCLNYDVASED